MEKKDFKILVVDDDEIARDVVGLSLQREGYNAVSAHDGLSAMQILDIEDMDLVITDLRMPGASGMDVLKHSIKNNPDTAVVIITAYGTLDTAIEAIKEGAYDYLTKPFNIQEILILAERAYERADLINRNKELRRHIRDTYRDLRVINAVSKSNHSEIVAGWIDRMEKLKTMDVFTSKETEMLKERLVKGYGKREDINS
jgi:DNA-binding NtrC family response regulator